MGNGLVPDGFKVDYAGNIVPDVLSVNTYSSTVPTNELDMSNLLKEQTKDNLFGDTAGTNSTIAGDAAKNNSWFSGDGDGSLFGISGDVLDFGIGLGQLGLGYLGYKDNHAESKMRIAGMQENLKNAQTEAAATKNYRASYGVNV